MSWTAYFDPDIPSVVHVAPTDEKGKHINSMKCPCFPRSIKEVDRMIVVHRSADGREAMEEALEILKNKK